MPKILLEISRFQISRVLPSLIPGGSVSFGVCVAPVHWICDVPRFGGVKHHRLTCKILTLNLFMPLSSTVNLQRGNMICIRVFRVVTPRNVICINPL